MNKNPECEADRKRVLDEIVKIERGFFDYCRTISRADTPGNIELKHMGYKTKEEAFLNSFNRASKKIEALIMAHERRFPD